MPALKVAAAQIECVPGDIAANLALHLDAAEAARARGVDLVVFPELSLTDYLSDPDTARLGRTVDAAEILALAEASRTLAVSFGFIERSAEGRFHNSQALAAGGRIVHVHRKLNLPTYGALREGLCYAPGSRLEAAVLPGLGRMTTLICADSWNPALVWLAALERPDLLLEPVASARLAVGADFDNPRGWDINLSHTAMTYGMPIVMVNHCGERGGLDFWGGSRIVDADGKVLARAGGRAEIVLATIDSETASRARARLPTIRDSDPALVRRELDRFLAGAGRPE